MPDNLQLPKVTTADSGQVKIEVPHNPKGETNVDVNPGTSVHEVLVERTETNNGNVEPNIERRKQQPPVQVQVGSAPGLPGIHGIIAQWGAFGVVLILCIFFWFNINDTQKVIISDARERDKTAREEIRAIRDSSDRHDQAFINALNILSTKIDQNNTVMVGMAAELKTGRMDMHTKLDKILDAVSKKLDEMVSVMKRCIGGF